MPPPLHVVTGAFSYSGSFIAQKLLAQGYAVKTLTHSARPHPLRAKIPAEPLDFTHPARLAESLRGAAVLYNTYWVRFNHTRHNPAFTHSAAVENTLALFAAARAAGVQRIVHTSITNPALDSPLEYFRGKAVLEAALQGSGLSYAILRPAVLFGGRDILLNNMAFLLRHSPVFLLPGDGQYRLQPIHVEDFADLAIRAGQSTDDTIIHALGPGAFTYRDLVRTVAQILHLRRLLVPAPPGLVYALARTLSPFLHDILITREEIRGLMSNLLYVPNIAPTGTIRLSEWARQNAATLGRHYESELARRVPRTGT